jgi:hypothetical protein
MNAATTDPGDGKKKSFLTHQRGREKAAQSNAEPQILEAQAIKKVMEHPAALSGKMAKISSLRESGGPDLKKNYIRDKASSTLPGAMARVHQQHQEEKIRERLQGQTSENKLSRIRTKASESLQMEDPDPGPAKSTLLFWGFFGRFAKSVLLVQPLQLTTLFYMLVALGSIEWSRAFLSPLPGPGQVYDQSFTASVMAGGMLLGLGIYFLISVILYLSLNRRHGGIGKFFGLKVVVNAFLPLALGQLIFMVTGSFMLGESYWRGMMSPELAGARNWVLPVLWIWGGYRVAQAVSGLFSLTLPQRVWCKLGICLIAGLPVLFNRADGLHPGRAAFEQDWAALKKDVMASGAALPVSRYNEMEKRLGFYDTARKRDLYLYRMQALYRLNSLDNARADALRLDRMAVTGSADDELAKGLNYLLQNRLDLALPKFEAALMLDPDCSPAHQWSALGLAAFDLDAAESHARILMENDPNVFHLQLLVRLLFAREKYQDIWDSMLRVDVPPEDWDPVTLFQGAEAAKALGNTRRADFLHALARNKGYDSGGD